MAVPETDKLQPKGSWPLRIIIAFLILFLLASVLYPEKLWQEHSDLIEASRAKMENLNYIVLRHQEVNGTFVADVDSLLRFIEQDSMLVPQPVFEVERLSIYEAPADSFLVGFSDTYHYDSISVVRVAEDSIIMNLIPKEMYKDYIPVASVAFAEVGGPHGVQFDYRDKGDKDVFLYVHAGLDSMDYVNGATSEISYYELPYEQVKVPSKNYLLFMGLDDIRIDPISGKPYELRLNAQVKLEASVTYKKARRNKTPENPVLDNELATNLLMNKMARQARAELEAFLRSAEDSTLYAQQLELANDYFEVQLEKTKSMRQDIVIDNDTELIVSIDSVNYYNDENIIRNQLFKIVTDKQLRAWQEGENVQEFFANLGFNESYKMAKVDTIGMVISVPFEGPYKLEPKSFLEKVFSVGSIENPGYIENNDFSWDEKR